ncbi:MAG: hypothetical protein O3B64_01080 [bacterium]|nr:hypothetical protein [bacterium]
MPSNTKYVTSPIVVVLTIVAVCLSALAVIISITGLFFNTTVDVRVGDSAINEAVKYAEIYEEGITEYEDDSISFNVPQDVIVNCELGVCTLFPEVGADPDMLIQFADGEIRYSIESQTPPVYFDLVVESVQLAQ